jgi:DNA polymerase-3 subunit delta'
MNIATFAPWQQQAYARAAQAIDEGRLAHGLLICGPARLGKRAVAEALAQRLLCEARAPGAEPCGQCRGCRLYQSRSQRDPVETRPDGSLAHPWGRPGHPDAVLVGHVFNDKASPPKMRSEIVIDQIRELSQGLSLTPQYGAAQVVLVDPADAVNHAACNALLKTLEEPQPGRYLWLISAHPARLPATIRSRCQRLEFRLPAQAEALQWLQAQGHAPKIATEALQAARGHPGLADAWLREGGMALRREVADDLQQLAGGRAGSVAVAKRWSSGDDTALRLRFAADLALEQAGSGLTDPNRNRRLAAWFDAANRTRDLLRTTVRADLAIAELLLAWRDAAAAPHHTGRR